MVTRTVHFTIQGEWLTKFSRNAYWAEYRFDYARELLGTCIGITPEQIDGILLGKYCLTGTSDGEGVVLKEDKSDFKKTYNDMNALMRQRIKKEMQDEKDRLLSEEARLVFDYVEKYDYEIQSRWDFDRYLKLAILAKEDPQKHDMEVHKDNMLNLGSRMSRTKLDKFIEEIKEEQALEVDEFYFEKNPKSIGAKKKKLILQLKGCWDFEQVMNYIKLYDEGKLNNLTDNCFISPEGLIFNIPNLQHTTYASSVYWFWNKILDKDKQDFGIGNESDLIDVKGFVAISAANSFSGGVRIRASGRGTPLTKKQEELLIKFCEKNYDKGILDSIGLNSRDKFLDNRNDLVKACARQRLEEKEWKR